MIQIQTYVQAQTLEEAWQLNQKRSARILGGMLWLKMESLPVSTAIDLCRLGLDAIEETEEQFTLGAMVTLRQIEQHAGLNAYTQGAAARAVQDIVGVQFRNMATLGGSLWSRFGFSDLLTWMLSMDTWVQLYRGGLVPLEQFAAMPYDRDLLVRVIVYKRPGRFAYQAMRNQRTDIPVLNCAFSQMEGVQIQRVPLHRGDRKPRFGRLCRGQLRIGGGEVDKGDRAPSPGKRQGVPPRSAADVEHPVAGTEILLHHPQIDLEFRRIAVEPLPLRLRRALVKGAHLFPAFLHAGLLPAAHSFGKMFSQ